MLSVSHIQKKTNPIEIYETLDCKSDVGSLCQAQVSVFLSIGSYRL